MDPFEDCLSKGRLKKTDVDIEKVASELDTAREEVTRARTCYARGNWGEAATQAYFALYRTARAAVNSQGYRDTNLYGLCIGVRRLFVDPGRFPEAVVNQIRDAKDIKDVVYEGGRATRRDARQLLSWALGLMKLVFGLLSLPGFEADSIDTALPEAANNRGNDSSEHGPRRGPRGPDAFRPRRLR